MSTELQALIARLADQEPNPGYANAGQLELSDQDVAAVVANDPSVITDAFADEDLARRIAGILPAVEQRPDIALAGIGAALVAAVRKRARAAIYADVLAECERRECA